MEVLPRVLFYFFKKICLIKICKCERVLFQKSILKEEGNSRNISKVLKYVFSLTNLYIYIYIYIYIYFTRSFHHEFMLQQLILFFKLSFHTILFQIIVDHLVPTTLSFNLYIENCIDLVIVAALCK